MVIKFSDFTLEVLPVDRMWPTHFLWPFPSVSSYPRPPPPPPCRHKVVMTTRVNTGWLGRRAAGWWWWWVGVVVVVPVSLSAWQAVEPQLMLRPLVAGDKHGGNNRKHMLLVCEWGHALLLSGPIVEDLQDSYLEDRHRLCVQRRCFTLNYSGMLEH